jgi:hypothetical protein
VIYPISSDTYTMQSTSNSSYVSLISKNTENTKKESLGAKEKLSPNRGSGGDADGAKKPTARKNPRHENFQRKVQALCDNNNKNLIITYFWGSSSKREAGLIDMTDVFPRVNGS